MGVAACLALPSVTKADARSVAQVGDASGLALAARSKGLCELKMPARMGDSTLAALSRNCRRLEAIDLRRCAGVSARAVRGLVSACSGLQLLRLPPHLEVELADLLGVPPAAGLDAAVPMEPAVGEAVADQHNLVRARSEQQLAVG